jgi:hypothetical protein
LGLLNTTVYDLKQHLKNQFEVKKQIDIKSLRRQFDKDMNNIHNREHRSESLPRNSIKDALSQNKTIMQNVRSRNFMNASNALVDRNAISLPEVSSLSKLQTTQSSGELPHYKYLTPTQLAE